LKGFLEKQRSEFVEKPGFAPLEETICRKVDDIVIQIWGQNDRSNAKGFALLAIGGYGRRTLHPESDLDLLLFFRDKLDEDVAKSITGSSLGPSFSRRTSRFALASDFKAFDPTHVESYAAFLDNRYLAGNERPARISARGSARISAGGIVTHSCAVAGSEACRYDVSVRPYFQLEPDLKDAPAGFAISIGRIGCAKPSKGLRKRTAIARSRSITACERSCTSRQAELQRSLLRVSGADWRRALATASLRTAKLQKR
jgi:hypothetical protein